MPSPDSPPDVDLAGRQAAPAAPAPGTTSSGSGRDGRHRARLVDVAEAAGVTKSVASRVLNGDKTLSVRRETREKVLAAATALRYHPHAGARALTSRSKALALLIPDLTNAAYARIARGAYQRAREHGYVVLLAEDTEESDFQSDFADLVSAGRVEGLLIASAREGHPLLDEDRLQAAPHVFVNRGVPGSGRNVSLDLYGASHTAFEFLQGLGHVRMGHISGPGTLAPAKERERGFVAAALESGYPRPAVAEGLYSEAGGLAATTELLATAPEVTAIYVGTLSQSIGVLKALRLAGVRVPQDVSVLSYDDLPLADYLEPSLSAVSLPLLELGQAAVDALVAQLEGAAPRDIMVDCRPVVVERASTGPPPATR